MNISPYRTRDQHIPVITRTSPTDSADGFMTVFGEINPNQISKRCSSCGIRQPLSNFFKKAISKLKKSQQKTSTQPFQKIIEVNAALAMKRV